MVERKISWEIYVIAFIITSIIFALGLTMGLVIEGERSEFVNEQDKIQKMDLTSLQLQYQFINVFSQEENCEVLEVAFDDSIGTLEKTRERIENYMSDSSLDRTDFTLLQREYALSQINYWLLAEKMKDVCGSDIRTVLYFFSKDEDCPDCEEQSFVLTYLKKKLGMNILNFAFGSIESEPMIDLLKNVYEVESYPTLIIDGEKHEGFVSKENMLETICPNYKYQYELCDGYVEYNVTETNSTE